MLFFGISTLITQKIQGSLDSQKSHLEDSVTSSQKGNRKLEGHLTTVQDSHGEAQ